MGSYGCTPEGCMLEDGTYEPWICSRAKIEVAKDCRIFSPANLRAAKEVAGYKRLVEHYMDDKYTLRYSGGLVPDIYQQFTRTRASSRTPRPTRRRPSCAWPSRPRRSACSSRRRAARRAMVLPVEVF